MNEQETREKQHLETVKGYLRDEIRRMDATLDEYAKAIADDITYYGEGRNAMDHAEKAVLRQEIASQKRTAERAEGYKERLQKLLKSPYFGRFDFLQKGKEKADKLYIGLRNFYYEKEGRPVIYDWRAPVSSIFYENETGPAEYEAPSGVIKGDVRLKRQFRIRDGEMEFMFDSALNITDDVLQSELARASDDGMKNIVTTIQRDQNAIIRNGEAPVLIIQGVAGSGKTSIALHRIAFLLYQYRETLRSEDVLIVSPNRVFADYISNVLPELGEESIAEMQMETLADEILDGQYPFETSFEQATALLEQDDEALKARVREKASPAFLETLDAYAEHVKGAMFAGEDIRIFGYFVPGWLFDEAYAKFTGYSKKEAIDGVTKIVTGKMEREFGIELYAHDKARLKKRVAGMHAFVSYLDTYKGLFEWMGRPELFTMTGDGKLEYADVFPMAYLKVRLEEKQLSVRETKHLLIDEMQDYTPVQYAVVARLFPCKKTIFGDANQAVNPYGSSNGKIIQGLFPEARYVTLNKSYRSSYEIMRFALGISPDSELEPMERHGEEPRVIACEDDAEESARVAERAREFLGSEDHTLGIICKTRAQADMFFAALERSGVPAHLLTAESTTFDQGIMVTTAHLAKGLEFDRVLIPAVTEENYRTEMDRNLLYVACTRAMHRLALTHTGTPSAFIA